MRSRSIAAISDRHAERRAIALGIICLALELISATACGRRAESRLRRGSRLHRLRRAGAVRGLSRAARQARSRPRRARDRSRAASRSTKATATRGRRSSSTTRCSSVGVLRIDVFEPRIAEVESAAIPGPHLARLETLGSQLRDDGPVTQAGVKRRCARCARCRGSSLHATTARDATRTHLYRLDLDTEFEPRPAPCAQQPRHGRGGPELRARPSRWSNGLLGGQTNLGAMFGAATDYDEYHGLGVLANVGVGARGGRLSFSGFSVALRIRTSRSSIATTTICAIAFRSRYARPLAGLRAGAR